MNQLKTAIKTYSWIQNYKKYVKKKGYRLQVFHDGVIFKCCYGIPNKEAYLIIMHV